MELSAERRNPPRTRFGRRSGLTAGAVRARVGPLFSYAPLTHLFEQSAAIPRVSQDGVLHREFTSIDATVFSTRSQQRRRGIERLASSNIFCSPRDDTEDRRAYLQGIQEQGYTCWIFPRAHESAACIQVRISVQMDAVEVGVGGLFYAQQVLLLVVPEARLRRLPCICT